MDDQDPFAVLVRPPVEPTVDEGVRILPAPRADALEPDLGEGIRVIDAGSGVQIVADDVPAADSPDAPVEPAKPRPPRPAESSRPATKRAPTNPERTAGGSGGAGGSGPDRGRGGGGGSGGSGGSGGGRGPKKPPPVDDAEATQRGVLVIIATVIIGLIVFWFGVHKPADNTQISATTESTTPGPNRNDAPQVTQASTGTTAAANTPTTKVAPKDLKILVANGVDPKKVIAGPVVTKLKAAGYTDSNAVDLTTTVDTSAIYFAEGFQGDAQAVATTLGWPTSVVTALPAKPPATLNGAKVLVVVGKDKG